MTFFSEELAMKPALKWMRLATLLAALLAVGSVVWAQGAAPAANPGYTTAEYNAYNTAKNTADPAAKIKALEGFIAQYNNPTLMPFVYRDLYSTYYAQKNYAKTIEYIDKLLALGDKVDAPTKLAALVNRGQAYGAGATDTALQTPEMLTKTREASAQGLTALAGLAKPAAMADAAFENQKKAIGFVFDSVAGIAASYQKDWKGAETAFKAALVLNGEDATTHYRLGAAYLQDMPPVANDGFWELGRSIALKIAGTDQVKQFMRGRLIQYQQPGCEKSADEEINQVLTLSAAGAERPATFNIPSAQELQMARDDTMNFLPWLQEGGAHGNTMWLATCGLEFPDVAVRVMEVMPGDAPDKFTLRVFRAPTQEEMTAASMPNMEIHIAGQPDVKKIPKDDFVRFTGTLNGYQPSPFLLTWDEAKINAEDLADLPAPGGPAAPGRGRGGAGRGRAQ
jgi:tetratricopeptide (TPR) repeat protein